MSLTVATAWSDALSDRATKRSKEAIASAHLATITPVITKALGVEGLGRNVITQIFRTGNYDTAGIINPATLGFISELKELGIIDDKHSLRPAAKEVVKSILEPTQPVRRIAEEIYKVSF